MPSRPWRVVVCGTRFGRVYLSALARGHPELELAGVLAAGSQRSVQTAAHYGAPLYTDIDSLPASIDAACVVVSSEMGGGPGSEIALKLLGRGIHVLQEHPIHHDELARLLRAARGNGVVHRMNTLYPDVGPVRAFLAAASALRESSPPVFISGACALQLKTSFLDIVGRALGKLRPWRFEAIPRAGQDAALPWRMVQGVIAGIPVSLQVQNQIHAWDPDNHCHLYHQLTLGAASGSVMLADTHGPVLWRPRPHIPAAIQRDERPESCAAPSLDFPTTAVIAPASGAWRDALVEEWPRAVVRALLELRREAAGEPVWPNAQFSLSLMQMVHDLDLTLGPPDIIRDDSPEPASAAPLEAAIARLL